MLSRAILLLSLATAVASQDVLPPVPPPVTHDSSLILVPALTPVTLRMSEQVSSNTHVRGDPFTFVVAEDVKVGEIVVIPAGSIGTGEVVHAARSGAGGKAGELILAARRVRVGEREVRLRSFAAGVGRDRTGRALALATAAGPAALLVRGGAMVFPADAIASAKTAESVELPAVVTDDNPPESSSSEQTTKGEEHVENDT